MSDLLHIQIACSMKHRKSFKIVSVIIIALISYSCVTQPSDIFNRIDLNSNQSITTGARQRIISNVEISANSQPNRIDPLRIICVEPSPDVATTIASSLGFGISVLGQGAGSISGSTVENLVQLGERTIAVQALLKQGYQACLDYANGAITATTYSIRTSKLDDLLVTLVLGEIAGGAYGRSGASTSGASDSSADTSIFGTGIADIDSRQSELELQNAEKNVIETEKKLEDMQNNLNEQINNSKTGSELDPFNKAVTDAKSELTVAIARRNVALRKLMNSSSSNTTASTDTESTGSGNIVANTSAEIASTLHDMQREFILKDIDNVYISTCMAELGYSASDEVRGNKYESITALDTKIAEIIEDGIKKRDENNYKLLMTHKNITEYFADTVSYLNLIKWKSGLYDHCNKNLDNFVRQAHSDRFELEKLRLEIESKKIDRQLFLASGAVLPENIGHQPRYGYDLLTLANEKLKMKKNELANFPIPTVNKNFPQAELDDLIKRKNNLMSEIDKHLLITQKMLAPNKKAEIENLESQFIKIISDLRRTGTETERKLWAAELVLHQAKIDVEYNTYIELSKSTDAIEKNLNNLIKEIRDIKQ